MGGNAPAGSPGGRGMPYKTSNEMPEHKAAQHHLFCYLNEIEAFDELISIDLSRIASHQLPYLFQGIPIHSST